RRFPLTARPTLFPYTTLFRSGPRPDARTIRGAHEDRAEQDVRHHADEVRVIERVHQTQRDLADVTLSRDELLHEDRLEDDRERQDRKSTRLNSSHVSISYAVC